MKNISITNRTTKTDGEVRIRFRLRDGRKVDLYHKSDIKASISDLESFDLATGEVKPRKKIYNKDLEKAIRSEIDVIDRAYSKMIDEGLPIDCKTFEAVIASIKHPNAQGAASPDGNRFDVRLATFIQDGLRDGIFGESRAKLYHALLAMVERFMVVFGLESIMIKDVDADMLMRFRQFIADEYLFVHDWSRLYEGQKGQNIPTKRRSQNTIATRMKMLQTFFNELEDREEIEKSPFRRLGKERKRTIMRERYDKPIYLKQSELQAIMDAEVPECLEDTRQAFTLQCAFGCRISDFKALGMDSISITDDGIPYIHYLPIKTSHSQEDNTEIQTPIVRYAFDLIKNNGFNFKILRNISGEKGYNAQIRELLKHCGIDRQCCEFNEETERNEYKPLWEFGCSKLARKTHVDIMSKVQVNLYASGLHKEGSQAVNHYTNMEIGDRFLLMCTAFHQPKYKVDADLNVIE